MAMPPPQEVKTWLEMEWAVVSEAPVLFAVAIVGVSLLIWGLMWLIFNGQLRGKDEQIKAKEEQGKTKDTIIDLLKLKLEGKAASAKQLHDMGASSMEGGIAADISAEVDTEGTPIKPLQAFPPTINIQQAIDELAELRSEGIHSILNAPIKNDDDWSALEIYQKDWWGRINKHLEKNFSRADQLNFTRLGAVPLITFPHVYNDKHAKMLREFVIQDERLREIIDRNLRRLRYD